MICVSREFQRFQRFKRMFHIKDERRKCQKVVPLVKRVRL